MADGKFFDYQTLKDNKDALMSQLLEHGFVAVVGVPGREETYEAFLKELQTFVNLSDDEKKKSTPDNSYEQGYSVGTETLQGVPDTHKSSFYGNDVTPETVWPAAVPGFKKAFLDIHHQNHKIGMELLDIIGLNIEPSTDVSRGLHYLNVGERTPDSNMKWCGAHRDHSVLTALAPAVYVKDGKRIAAPEDSGLFVRGVHVKEVPLNAILFQMGETAELLTNGKVTATEHWVQKAFGCERLTFVTFMAPKADLVINSTCESYNDRYKPGMTYRQFEEATFKKYY